MAARGVVLAPGNGGEDAAGRVAVAPCDRAAVSIGRAANAPTYRGKVCADRVRKTARSATGDRSAGNTSCHEVIDTAANDIGSVDEVAVARRFDVQRSRIGDEDLQWIAVGRPELRRCSERIAAIHKRGVCAQR